LQVRVFITPRHGILDPQGRAVESSLKSLGFAGVASVRVGRYITIDLDAGSSAEAEAAVKQMCDQLLANPNIEDYRFAVVDPIEPAREPPAIPAPNASRKFFKVSE
jgi:phosphoribosylformylglycinamidine synthase subunit PurS